MGTKPVFAASMDQPEIPGLRLGSKRIEGCLTGYLASEPTFEVKVCLACFLGATYLLELFGQQSVTPT